MKHTKKSAVALLLTIFLVMSLKAQTPQPQPKPEDALKNLVRVEKVQSPPDRMKAGFDSINAKDSYAMLNFLASDLLEGRETATRGYQLAAEYAVSLFALWKIQPAFDAPRRAFRAMGSEAGAQPVPQKTYLQEFALKEIISSDHRITLELKKGVSTQTRTFLSGIDYSSFSSSNTTFSAPVVFAGYGITEKSINWDDFKGIDVSGKIILILPGAPGQDNPQSPFQKNKELKDKYFPQPQPMMMAQPTGFNKVQEIMKLGALAVIQVATISDAETFRNMLPGVRSDDRPYSTKPRRRLIIPGRTSDMPWERSAVITITKEMANAILENTGQKIDDLQKKIDTTLKPASQALPGTTLTVVSSVNYQLVKGVNVVGYIEGSDPKLKEEVVIVGAHLDHLGYFDHYVYNGADDNGSGSVGVLNIARAMAQNPVKPKRTVVFALWTGEEQGLLGSRFYTMHPPFPIAKTIAYFNLDMISRPYNEQLIQRASRMFNFPSGQELIKQIKPANFLPVSFSAGAGLGDILRQANEMVGLDIFLRESTSQGRAGGGSDHSSFASVNVPWVFAIAASTEDYHQTSDSIEKVSPELMEKISKLIYVSIYLMADK